MPKKVSVEIPEEYSDMGEAWHTAYGRAFAKGCSEKAAALYANTHFTDFEDGIESLPDDSEILKARIAELEGQISSAKAS